MPRLIPPTPCQLRPHYLRALMNDAWTIARAGQARFGGRTSEYVPLSLREAWTTTKANPRAWPTAQLMRDFRP